ncbi:MAG TPA: phosphotransferase [bacterium]|nr:phosphotransferase [bacterium]
MDETSLLEKLKTVVAGRLKKPDAALSLAKLQGDASYRIYYRLSLSDGSSYIVMKLPAGKASASEEITNLKTKPAEIPFVAVDRFLKARGLPVPEIYEVDEAAGILVLEDFGDETFEKRVMDASDDARKIWYRKAIDLLATYQKATSSPDAGCVAYQRSFDATLLNWEFDHFLEYGVETRLGVKIQEDDARTLRTLTGRITESLVALPQILVHRDFQSRNLMIQNEELHLLDFQDALMGPLPYDLVALLRDSYVALSPHLLLELVSYYQGLSPAAGSLPFQTAFDLMTVQRKLKDAGRFVYIDRVKGNPSFLKHIPNSLRYVREAFGRLPDQKPLFDLLTRYVPEWRAP